MKKLYTTILALSLALLMSVSAFASSINDAKKDLDSISGDIKDTKQELNEVKNEQDQVRNQLNQIEEDLTIKEQELAAVESQLKRAQSDIEAVKGELQEAEEELSATQAKLELLMSELEQATEEAKQQEELNASRLRAMYMNSSASYLELIMEAKSLNDLLTRIDMIIQMINYDQLVFDKMQLYRDEVELKKLDCEEQEQIIQDYKSGIEEKKAVLEQKEQQIQANRDQIAKQKQQIQATQNEKETLMGQLGEEEAKMRKELDQLEKESKQLENKIRELTRAQQSRGNNNNHTKAPDSNGMMWPVPGYSYISSPFGMRRHPITKDNRMHTGIDIAGGGISNKSAVAMADGVVILSQYYGGYGNTVIIDHGGGISSLYAHGWSTTVSVGQQVKKGDTVLKVGSTGSSTGPHLHFEVRKNGSPVNPLGYVSP